jgi:hypothetical protein
VILEWTSFLVRVGYAEQHKPQHTVPWTDTKQTPKTEREWYQIVGPLLERIWNMLMSAASTRRVVVLHPPYMERTWEAAMYKGLWNLGVPGIVFVNALEMVPIAMGWSRGMVIQVGMKETWCMAHVDGHGLKNTLQGKSIRECDIARKTRIFSCGFLNKIVKSFQVATIGLPRRMEPFRPHGQWIWTRFG